MITALDEDYLDTKLIKHGYKKLNTPFRKLADWINKEYDVNVLNIYYDFIDNGKRPRLNIIFEFLSDANKFKLSTETYYGYDEKKQADISAKFKEIIDSTSLKGGGLFKRLFSGISNFKYSTENIWVIFSSFEPIAKSEANKNIPEEKIQELKDFINDKELWEISRFFSYTTFFFYTDEQVKDNMTNGKKEKYTELYYNLLKRYDEFDYLNKENFSISFDSKENLDTNYQGNWYYYYK